MSSDIAQFGLGSFGSVHLSDSTDLGLARAAVDIDQEKKSVTEENEVPFYNVDVTEFVDIHRGDSITHSYYPDWEEDAWRALVEDVDTWDIVTETPEHLPIMIAGIEEGLDIFVEKPPAETVDELSYLQQTFPDAQVAVDYIEMEHPAVRAAQQVMEEDGERPGYSFHWRSKDLRGNPRGIGGGEGSRITLEDLLHDVSELDSIRRYVLGRDISESQPNVTDANLYQWNELHGDFPYQTDVQSSFTLEFEDGMEADVGGSFADRERRYFVVTNPERDYAVFVNTLDRDHIDPLAAVVEGEERVDTVLDYVGSGEVLDGKDQEEMLDETGGKTLYDVMDEYVPEEKWVNGEPKYGWAPVFRMLQKVDEAESPEDLTCSLKQAAAYQEVGEEIYSEAGLPRAQHLLS